MKKKVFTATKHGYKNLWRKKKRNDRRGKNVEVTHVHYSEPFHFQFLTTTFELPRAATQPMLPYSRNYEIENFKINNVFKCSCWFV